MKHHPLTHLRTANQLPGILKLPSYLSSIAYRNPGSHPSDATYFQYAHSTPLTFFQSMQTTPQKLAHFQSTMATALAVERQWHPDGFASIYPFASLSRGAFPDETILVEVGGGHGHVIRELRATLPDFRGRMVVLDLPAVLSSAPAQDDITFLPYNFLTTPQPIHGARAYLFRHVLLDWSDADCRTILLNTIPALTHPYSRILIAESILPAMERDTTPYKAMMDVQMMRFEGRGRKERQWRSLFEGVGLEVVRIWEGNGGDEVMELRVRVG